LQMVTQVFPGADICWGPQHAQLFAHRGQLGDYGTDTAHPKTCEFDVCFGNLVCHHDVASGARFRISASSPACTRRHATACSASRRGPRHRHLGCRPSRRASSHAALGRSGHSWSPFFVAQVKLPPVNVSPKCSSAFSIMALTSAPALGCHRCGRRC